eukprot:6020409-Prymnesium_polylepis.1
MPLALLKKTRVPRTTHQGRRPTNYRVAAPYGSPRRHTYFRVPRLAGAERAGFEASVTTHRSWKPQPRPAT